jgi:hypothetical protein
MAEAKKDDRSVLRLGQRASSDPNAWRPSKAVAQDSGLSLGLTPETQTAAAQEKNLVKGQAADAQQRDALKTPEGGGTAWRPSRVNAERLGSLSPGRVRRRFAMPRGLRPALTLVFFICAAYVFLKLWFTPTAGELHPALAIVAGILALVGTLLIVGAIMRRKRKGSDDKSTLRL